jgi:hypothetical protein
MNECCFKKTIFSIYYSGILHTQAQTCTPAHTRSSIYISICICVAWHLYECVISGANQPKEKLATVSSKGNNFCSCSVIFKRSNAVISKLNVLRQGKDNSSLNYAYRCQIFSVVLETCTNNQKNFKCIWKHFLNELKILQSFRIR